MAAGSYVLTGLNPLTLIQAGVVLGTVYVLVVARRDETMLTFDDPSLSPWVRRYAPFALAALGSLTLAVGLGTLALALS
jgi:hypothetical protein